MIEVCLATVYRLVSFLFLDSAAVFTLGQGLGRVIALLYLEGISTGDFGEVLTASLSFQGSGFIGFEHRGVGQIPRACDLSRECYVFSGPMAFTPTCVWKRPSDCAFW